MRDPACDAAEAIEIVVLGDYPHGLEGLLQGFRDIRNDSSVSGGCCRKALRRGGYIKRSVLTVL